MNCHVESWRTPTPKQADVCVLIPRSAVSVRIVTRASIYEIIRSRRGHDASCSETHQARMRREVKHDMSSTSRDCLNQDEFEHLKVQLRNVKLTDAQVTDLALILKDKFEQNKP